MKSLPTKSIPMKPGRPGAWRAIALALALAGVAPTALTQQAPTAPAQSPAAETPRPGYLLVMGTVTDREALARYGATLGPIYAQYGGRPIAIGGVGGKVRVLEGQFPQQSLVLSRFGSIDGPNAFWWSPEYRRSVELRRGAGTFTVLRLKGVPGDADPPAGKPAYLISIADIRDRDKLKPYAAAALPLVKAAGAKFLSSGSRKDIELLEGEFGNLTVNLLQFPSIEALRRFYEDPAYQEIIPIRQSAGDYVLLEVDAG
jgi:uncharacterized protein (DUF1330 family)